VNDEPDSLNFIIGREMRVTPAKTIATLAPPAPVEQLPSRVSHRYK